MQDVKISRLTMSQNLDGMKKSIFWLIIPNGRVHIYIQKANPIPNLCKQHEMINNEIQVKCSLDGSDWKGILD